jgi:hypothetical protein
LDQLWTRLNETGDTSIEEIFLSEKVAKSIPEEKAYLPSFDFWRILALLPFYKNVYVCVCPACLSRDPSGQFAALVEAGAMIPVLSASYRLYDDSVRNLVASHDHVSAHEFSLFRTMTLLGGANGAVCQHCIDRKKRAILRVSKASEWLAKRVRDIDAAFANLYPYLSPDYDLIDRLHEAAKKNNLSQFDELSNLSWTINSVRSMQALNAPVLLDESELASVPKGFSIETDEVRGIAADLQSEAYERLRIRIPTDIPLDQYLEIAREFQPQLRVIASTLSSATKGVNHATARTALLKKIMQINAEVERIKGLKRYAFLEAAINFFERNKALAATTFIAGALGLAGGVIGCASGVAISVAGNLAKKKGLIQPNDGMRKLARLAKRDVQPYLNNLVAMYVGSDTPAVTLLSIRRRIPKRAAA